MGILGNGTHESLENCDTRLRGLFCWIGSFDGWLVELPIDSSSEQETEITAKRHREEGKEYCPL